MTTSWLRIQTLPESVDVNVIGFTAHNYAEHVHSKKLTNEHGILDSAYKIIKSSTSGQCWINCPQPRPVSEEHYKQYTYAREPPAVNRVFVGRIIKEWDAPLAVDEIFRLSELEDFETSLPSNVETLRKKQVLPERTTQPNIERMKLLDGSIYSLIPQPHMHPSPFFPNLVLDLEEAVPSMHDATYIAPYTSFSIPIQSRIAWLIPVRGKLHSWPECTAAFIIESGPIPVNPDSQSPIYWPKPALLEFWMYLLELREKQKFGALAISLVTASQRRPRPATIDPHTETTSKTMIRDPPGSVLPPPDFIKVYHDPQYSMSIRRSFEQWAFRFHRKGSGDEHVRILKGTKLVLVDDASKGILIA